MMRMYMIITYFPLKLEMQRRLRNKRNSNSIDRKVPKYQQKVHETFHFISLYSIQMEYLNIF